MIRTVGILRETKNPPDRRVALTPSNIADLRASFPKVKFFVQPSELRAYRDEEYTYLNIPLKEDLSGCDLLLGVKEVNKDLLIPNKKYLFFSHTAKKQAYNRSLLQEVLKRKITLLDYEYLTDENGIRLVAFGKWAGIVGAYKALRAHGIRSDRFKLKPAYQCFDMDELHSGLKQIKLKPKKILLTGEGRAASGAMETLSVLNIKRVSPEDFLKNEYCEPVLCQIGPQHYTKRKDGEPFDFNHFIQYPQMYESNFLPFAYASDILIACHYWDPQSPRFFKLSDMCDPRFRLRIIADVSCDIKGAIPTTMRPTTNVDSFYDVNLSSGKEEKPFSGKNHVTVMAVDNLPSELPRNSSAHFGKALSEIVMAEFFKTNESSILKRATIVEKGKITQNFTYLDEFAGI